MDEIKSSNSNITPTTRQKQQNLQKKQPQSRQKKTKNHQVQQKQSTTDAEGKDAGTHKDGGVGDYLGKETTEAEQFIDWKYLNSAEWLRRAERVEEGRLAGINRRREAKNQDAVSEGSEEESEEYDWTQYC